MNQADLNTFLLGAVVMACAVATVFFLRFWGKTRDRLFGVFALAFALLGLNWLTLAVTDPNFEFRAVLYVLRLLAFVVIILGILDKNRDRPARG
jgi:hypothetical protein